MAVTEECATGVCVCVRAGALACDGCVLDREGWVLGRDGCVLGRDGRVLGRAGAAWCWTRGAEALTWAWYAARARDREIREICREAPAAEVFAAAWLATA